MQPDQRTSNMNPPNHNYYYNMPQQHLQQQQQQQHQHQQQQQQQQQSNWHTETAIRYNVHGHYDMSPPYRHTSISYASRSEIAPISQHDGQYDSNEVSRKECEKVQN